MGRSHFISMSADMKENKTDRKANSAIVHAVCELMEIINNSVAHLPISVGDVIIEDVFGCNVVATKNM